MFGLQRLNVQLKRSGRGNPVVWIIAGLAMVVLLLYRNANRSSRRSRQQRKKILDRYRESINEKDDR